MKKITLLTIIALLLLPSAFAQENPLYPFRTGGLWGYMDRAGSPVIAPQYLEAADFCGPAALVLREDGYMLIDRQGSDLLAQPARMITGPIGGEDGFYEVLDAYETQSYYDLKYGRYVAPPFDWVTLAFASAELIPGGFGSQVGYLRRSMGEIAIQPIYEPNDLPLFFGDGPAAGWVMAPGGMDNSDISHCDIIHPDGRVVTLPRGRLLTGAFSAGLAPYEDIALSQARTAEGRGWLLGLIDAEGSIVLEPRYLWIGDEGEGYRAVGDEHDLWGHIDLTGRVVVPPKFPGTFGDGTQSSYRFQNGAAVFALRDGGFLAIDPAGNALFELAQSRGYVRVYPRMDNGLHWVEKDWAFGLIDGEGRELLPPAYQLPEGQEYRRSFSQGLQAIGRDGLWGYADDGGQIAIPLQYAAAQDFVDGLARVEKDGKMGYIDPAGTTVWMEP